MTQWNKEWRWKAVNQENAKLRRYEDDLNVCGFGIILLGAWSVLKLNIQLLSYAKEILKLEKFEEYDRSVFFVSFALAIVLFVVLSLLVCWPNYYIGRNAMKAAKGQAYKKGYFTWTVILLVLSVLGLIPYKDSIMDLSNIDITIASLLVDLTTIYILGTILVATRKIREIKAEKQIRE